MEHMDLGEEVFKLVGAGVMLATVAAGDHSACKPAALLGQLRYSSVVALC